MVVQKDVMYSSRKDEDSDNRRDFNQDREESEDKRIKHVRDLLLSNNPQHFHISKYISCLTLPM